ncbi:TonB-dependent receptor, partial [Bacteroidota bacterium]
SLAYKTGDYSNISLAYGQYQQATNDDLLRIANNVGNEKSSHYILNYQYIKQGRTFRIEGYYKQYHNLVKYDPLNMYDPSTYNNTGEGYAQGIDIFWRDCYGTLKNADYWISYSFLDTERDYRDFPSLAIPVFASKHNISVAYKQFFPTLRSFFSGTYTFASARPYHDPNSDGFNTGRTSSYNDLSATIAYMATSNIGVFMMCTNILGINNVYGYEYSTMLSEDGDYNRRAIVPPAKRLLLVGATLTLSKNGVLNQLRSL